ncbi:MAG: hypothetical protein KatS3mg114_1216 [Planctomycetaceae bacterium]|nr:MAG: hypothetical protein KatS3mg114_1216 [Planctomycetaceae bacterium]
MKKEFVPEERWFALLEAVCEERATPAELAELDRLVRENPQARWFYLSYLELHGNLLWDAGHGFAGLPEEAETKQLLLEPKTAPQSKRRWPWWMAVAVVLLLGLVMWWRMSPGVQPELVQERRDTPTEAPAAAVQPTPPVAKAPRRPIQLRPADPLPLRSGMSEANTSVVSALQPENQMMRSEPPAAMEESADSVLRVAQRVDQLLEQSWSAWQVEPAPPADDAEWLRRVYLQLTGRIPTWQEAEQFLQDTTPDKRRRVVDALLDSGEYARHMATWWAQLLVGRAPSPRVNRHALHKYLRLSFAANKPWSLMVAELITAEGSTEENGAANFLVAHLNNQAVPATAITARLFLGIQMHCAQCHHHPFNEMRQSVFWEFNSLFQQAAVQERVVTGGRRIIELVNRPEGGPIYYETLQGLMKVAFPRFLGQEIDPAPEVPRRQRLAELLTQSPEAPLAAPFINRLWQQFLGAGFTRPIDDMGPHNPPAHPEILQLLAQEFVRSGYDTKALIRWICASRVYQLSSRHPDGLDELNRSEVVSFRQVYARPMSPEQLYDSLIVATRAHQAGQFQWEAAEQQRQQWLQRFVISLENDENDEAETLTGSYRQALMMMNGEWMVEALSLKPGTFLAELLREPMSDTERIKRLFLATLTRYPTPREMAMLQRQVTTRLGQRAAVYQDLFWALLNSNEFCLIH